MRLIDTHRLLLCEGVVMMSKKAFGRAARLSDIPDHLEGAIVFRHATNACAIMSIKRASSRKMEPIVTGTL